MNKKRKIGVIGIGNVGAHVASSIANHEICEELVLIDCQQAVAAGHAADLSDTLPCLQKDMQIYAGGYEALADADILIISAAGSVLEEDRLKELDVTVVIMDEIIPNIKKSGFQGIILSISNPCDLIAQYLHEKTGLSVIGTGTLLDTARLQMKVARKLGVAPSSVQGYVLGEHGDSQMVPWSLLTVGGMPISDWVNQFKLDFDMKEVSEEAKHAGWEIVQGKGCTEFGIGAVAMVLARTILQDEKRVFPVSVYLEEHEIYASVPCIIGRGGAEKRLALDLMEQEQKEFDHTCEVLKKNKKRLNQRVTI